MQNEIAHSTILTPASVLMFRLRRKRAICGVRGKCRPGRTAAPLQLPQTPFFVHNKLHPPDLPLLSNGDLPSIGLVLCGRAVPLDGSTSLAYNG